MSFLATEEYKQWLDTNLSKFEQLTDAVAAILRGLIGSNGVPVLSVGGRTKTKSSCVEKVSRKKYSNPVRQMTDVSGIRVIVFFEHDVQKVCQIVRGAFRIDDSKSVDKDSVLPVNQFGYRSVHYVCDIGDLRAGLPEFEGLKNLHFEVQIRTVLQHAWAELTHDRYYKFSGELPKPIERQLYLLAASLESADGGFSSLSKDIDAYASEISSSASKGELDIEINSLSLKTFVLDWAESQKFFVGSKSSTGFSELIEELRQFGVTTLGELQQIIPTDYGNKIRGEQTIYGIVRDWMMISNPRKFISDVDVKWVLVKGEERHLRRFLSASDVSALIEKCGEPEEDYYTDDP